MKFKKRSIVVFLILIFIIILFEIYQFDDREVSPTNQWVVSNNDLVISETSDLIELNKVHMLQSEYQNTDIKGILLIENEDGFVYPVAQTSDNEYYLNHTYNETAKRVVVNCPVKWRAVFEEAFKYTETLHEEECSAVEKIAWTEQETK